MVNPVLRKRPSNHFEAGAYEKEVYSSKALATGNQEIVFFDGENETNGVHYKKGRNIFENGRGSLLEIGMEITGPAGACVDLGVDAVRDAINNLVAYSRLEIEKNTLPIYKGLMRRLVKMPVVAQNVTTGEPAALAMDNRSTLKIFKGNPPVWNKADDNQSFRLIMPPVAAALNGYIIIMYVRNLEMRPK